jgi:tetratricopeptide (TPR) repeat protein
MDWKEQILTGLRYLYDHPEVTWSGSGIYVVSTLLGLAGAGALWLLVRCFRKKNSAEPQDASALLAGSVLTIEQYKKDLLEQHGNYFLEKQKREEIERKLANLEESYQEKLRLLEESKKKLQQLAGSLPKQQLAEAEKRLAQGDTELAEQLFDRVAEETGQTAAAALLQSGRLAEDRLDYRKALRNYAAAVALAPDNPDYLLLAGWMAWTMGDCQRAEKWLKQLVAIREEKGKEDEKLALALNELAVVHVNQGRYEEAETLYKRSLKISEKALGEGHVEVATILNNLSALYQIQNRYEEAELLHKRSLEIKEKILGKEHPDVASSLNNLAELYRIQRRYEEAELLHTRSLKIRQEKLGEDHPDVAITLNNLAVLYESQHRYKEAALLYKQSLAIVKKVLGNEHPYIASSLNNLAKLYYLQGRYAEAEPLYQRALAILNAKFPDGHPNIDTFQANYNTLKEEMQGR